LEASASGLPVICVNKGGVQDLVHHENTGFIARANDADDFAQKIQILIKNDKLRKKFSAKAKLLAKNYSWPVINKNLVKSYEELIVSNKCLRPVEPLLN
jgi:glycosyltransferase involved in cell wall biosynthesis